MNQLCIVILHKSLLIYIMGTDAAVFIIIKLLR